MTFNPLAHARALLTASTFTGAAIIAMAAPSNAAIQGCQQFGTGGSWLFSDIGALNAAGGCYSSDKIYSNFRNFSVVGGGAPPIDDNFQFSLITGLDDLNHFLSVQAVTTPFQLDATYSFTYDVAVWTGDNLISVYATGATSSDPLGAAWTKTLSGPGSPVVATNESPLAFSDPSFINPAVASATFTSAITVTKGEVTSITDAIRQVAPSTTVPGPLPLLGAAAAFGYSRRIRMRIKSTKSQIA